MIRPSVLCWFALLPLVACKGGDVSDDTDVPGESDTDASEDTDVSGDTDVAADTDVTTDTDATDTDVAVGCSVSTADFGDASLTHIDAFTMSASYLGLPGNAFSVQGDLELGSPSDGLGITLLDQYGVFSGGDVSPGTYALTGDETNYFTCGACVEISGRHTRSGSFETYMATGGTLSITQLDRANDNMLELTLSEVTLVHVDLDASAKTTTPNPDGCATHIRSLSFSGKVPWVP